MVILEQCDLKQLHLHKSTIKEDCPKRKSKCDAVNCVIVRYAKDRILSLISEEKLETFNEGIASALPIAHAQVKQELVKPLVEAASKVVKIYETSTQERELFDAISTLASALKGVGRW